MLTMIFLILLLSFCVSSPISQTDQIQNFHRQEQLYFTLVNYRSQQLQWMCEHGDRDRVESLLGDGADPSSNNNYCLKVACSNSDRLMAALLLSLDPSKGIDPAVDNNFCLREASYRNDYILVYMLLSLDPSRGVDPTAGEYRVILEAALRNDYYFLIWILQDRRVYGHYDKIRERAVTLKKTYDDILRTSESSNLENFIGFLDRCRYIFTSRDADTLQSMRIIGMALRDNYADVFTYLSHPDFSSQQYGILKKIVKTLAQGRSDSRFDYLFNYLSDNEYYLTTDPFKNNYDSLLKLSHERNWDAVDRFLENFSSDQLTEAIAKIPSRVLKVRLKSFKEWKYPLENKLGIW